MRTIDLDLLAARSRSGHAADPDECLAAARDGRLWDVDTQSAGADSYVIADDGDEALASVYEGDGRCDDPPPAHLADEEWSALGWAERARVLRWSAERVALPGAA